MSCSASTTYKIRELAAKAFVSLALANFTTEMSFGAMLSNINSTLEQAIELTIEQRQIVHHNSLHGYLLQVIIGINRGKVG